MKKNVLLVIALLFIFAGLTFAAEDFKIRQLDNNSQAATYAEGEIVVKFKSDIDDQNKTKLNVRLGTAEISTSRYSGVTRVSIPADKTVEEMVEMYKADPSVEYAEPNYVVHAFMTPDDPYYSYQWHMPMINMEEAWDLSTGSGVVVAVVDCGVAYEDYGSFAQAPDLAGTNFVQGYDFVNGDSHPNDDEGHGTHVTGTIAQTTNNSLGVTGVAFNCSIMPVKVLDASGSGYITDIADGIYYAADNGAHVINMSLGSSSTSTTLESACTYAYNAGVTIVCAAGNDASSTPQYPASYSSCISVSAVGFDSSLAYYSSYGSYIDITAPGGDLTADENGDGYVDGVLQQTHDGSDYSSFGYYFYQGTSMASPHVAGVAALILSKAGGGGSLTPAEVKSYLTGNAVDIGSSGWDQYFGYGLLDANASVAAVSGGSAPAADFSTSTTSGCVSLTVSFTDASTNSPTSWSWTFGDGGTSTSQNPSHTYTTAGTYTVTLTATNEYGSDTETKTDYITVTDVPTAAFTGTPTSGEAPLTVTFTDGSSDATSWSWVFGDGGTSTDQNPSYTYTAAGTYTVALTATNSCGDDTYTATDYITVTCTEPVAAFTGTPTSGEIPLTVTFTDGSSDATAWSWDFGDGGTSTDQNPSYTYTEAGTYTVTLTVTNYCGSDTYTETDYITTTCTAPTASFTGTPTSGEVPLDVEFTDASTGATAWSWDFGDGGTSTEQNPTYTYESEGIYSVALTVTNDCGSDTYTETDYVTVTCTAPAASFTGSPTSGEYPLEVTFTDASTGATAWSWDFGDGGTSTDQNPSYTYTAEGTYTVALTVTNSCGSDTYTETDYITVTEPSSSAYCDDFDDGDISDWTILSGDWTVSDGQLDGYISSGKAFIMSPLGDVSDATISVDWTSLSGGTWTNGIVVFGYEDADNYRVADFRDGANTWYIREFISGTQYNRASLSETINTNQQYAMVVTIDASGLVTVTADGETKVSYDFGDVQTGQVGLEVNQSNSQFDNFCVDYEPVIPDPPTAGFSATPTEGYAPLTVAFTDESIDDPTSWAWDFGDGGTSTEQNPSYTYDAAGIYTVSLTATNAYGSDTHTETDYITVNEGGDNVMHVYDIVVDRYSYSRRYYYGEAVITIYDQNDDPVEGATVYADYTGSNSGSVSGTTDSDGEVTLETSTIDRRNYDEEWCFEVTDVVLTDWTYDESANEVTEACESGDVYGEGGMELLPTEYGLSQNYPNPFNPMTTISFSLPAASKVTLTIYNIRGQVINTLVDNNTLSAGEYHVDWDASDYASGIYFYKLQTADFSETKKMILLK